MEVHHHPNVEKKNFKEYFLEFLMIFLAVTMGFFAESLREHLVERNKEAEYMHSLSSDFKTDTARITEAINYNQGIYKSDSMLLSLLNMPKKDSIGFKKMYELIPRAGNFDFQFNDSKTFDQLKSTGDFRLIKNKLVLDSIAKYYQLVDLTLFFRNEIQSNLELTYNFSNKIFDQYTFYSNPNKNAPLITNDFLVLKEYSNRLYNLEMSYQVFNNKFLFEIRTKAVNLIALIDKEYHLKNE